MPMTRASAPIFGDAATITMRDTTLLSELSDEDCQSVEGLMIFRQYVTDADMARMPRLRCIVRMGVGYDRIDRAAAARRSIIVCNVPDYGTAEVAEHAIALAMALRRGLFMHFDALRDGPAHGWWATPTPLLRRTTSQTFGVVGLGRIGTAAALRAKALGFRTIFFDPNRPNGADLALGIGRAATLHEMLEQSDVVSMHVPQTPETVGMMNAAAFAAMRKDSVFINTAPRHQHGRRSPLRRATLRPPGRRRAGRAAGGTAAGAPAPPARRLPRP